MKKKLFILCLLMAMLLIVSNALAAESWKCSSCGTANTGKFCSECGAAKPVQTQAAASTITDIRCSLQSNGDVAVSWSDSGKNSPYRVSYTTDEWQGSWYEQESVKGTNAVLQKLIPGVTYYIIVQDNAGNVEYEAYEVPFKVYTEFESRNNLKLTKNKLSLSALQKDPTIKTQLRISWPKLKKARDYKSKLVLHTPLGYTAYAIVEDSFTMSNRYVYNYYNLAMSSSFLRSVESDFGTIPTGTYRFEMYFDGQLYDSCEFTLNN